MRKFIDIKGKVSLYSNRIIFSYNQWCHRLHLGSTQYNQFPLKKKIEEEKEEREGKRDGNKWKRRGKEKGRRRKGNRWKRGEEEKGMERVCSKGKGKGRMRCGRKDEEKGEGEGDT